MIDQVEIRSIKVGVLGGFSASVLYPVLLFAPLPLPVKAAVGSLLGPAIGVGSLGLYHLIRLTSAPSLACGTWPPPIRPGAVCLGHVNGADRPLEAPEIGGMESGGTNPVFGGTGTDDGCDRP
jgi:hypothetical protein